VATERTVLAGFSQGACLACEAAARRGGRWGAVAAFTGGVPGPAGEPLPDYAALHGAAAMDDTAVFLGAGDPDPHVPWARVEETAQVFRGLGADVTLRRYPGLGHTVNDEEVAWLRRRLDELTAG
jgi:predicted esterase